MPVLTGRLGNFLLQERLGAGYSGSIYKGINVFTGEVVALKIQDVNHECPTNRYERAFYGFIQGGVGVPTLWASGLEGGWDYLVLDLLGPSLDRMYRDLGKNVMDLRTTICVAIQMLSRLEHMHNRGVLHRDIQLGNCTLGLPPHQETLYIIDFGFGKNYIDTRTKRHIADNREPRDFIGNYWFSSVAVHCKGRVPTRRDDVEALALMLIHLLIPNGLPWTRNGIPKTETQHDVIKDAKEAAQPEDLCKGLPPVFEEFLRYCRRLKFTEAPDYDFWRDEFRELLEEKGFGTSDGIIWPPPPSDALFAHVRPVDNADEMNDILDGLANLDFAERPILGDKKNIASAMKAAKAKAGEKNKRSENKEPNTPPSLPKATQLVKLKRRALDCTNNRQLATVVSDFADCLRGFRSKVLTKEGFDTLDAIHKQLADPSVFVQPIQGLQQESKSGAQAPVANKLAVLARLSAAVQSAEDNIGLAGLLKELEDTIRRTPSRTMTRDALAFLDGLSSRLAELA